MFYFFRFFINKKITKGSGYRVFKVNAGNGNSFVYEHVADSANFKESRM
ncbi:hypothetical protein VCSRO147_0647 [Vibrio cholerae]|nr:hypothetical protein VCSRO147_0647 [Vibrio cholerae]